MLRTLLIAVLSTALVAMAAPAVGDDFNPPSWRGWPLTLQVEWEFETSNMIDVVPTLLNSVGDGTHVLGNAFTHAHPQTMFWEPDPAEPGDGRVFTTDMPGVIDCYLVNWIDLYPLKYVWVQVTYGGQGIPSVYEVVAPNQQTNDWVDPVYGTVLGQFDWGPGQRLESWILPYNPDREYVNIAVPPFTWIDQIMIDTISAPGPVSTEGKSFGRIKSLFR